MSWHSDTDVADNALHRPGAGLADALRAPEVPGLKVVRLLGVGGRAAVWLVHRLPKSVQSVTSPVVWVAGEDTVPGELALKVPLAQPRSMLSLRSCRQELEAMIPLSHPHVVRAWGIARTAETSGVLMDAYPAGSLAQLLRSAGPLPAGAVVTALMPIATALAHLHRQGASHGDITSANILLSSEGRPALGDLGESTLLGMSTAHGSAAGDIADLAAVAWRALTGHAPDPEHRRAPLGALRTDIPYALSGLLEESLAVPEVQRPNAEDFAAELYACAEPVPLQLADHVDDEALAELPTQLPARKEPGPGRWAGLLTRLGIRSAGPQRPSWASKLPSSRRAFRVWRKRPASAPSTIR